MTATFPPHTTGTGAGSVTRRQLLRAGGAGLLGLTLPNLLRAEESAALDVPSGPPPRAKSVIFLYQFGGPSHVDMFDRKPDAPSEIRGPLKEISTKLPGVPICANLPRVADIMDKVTLIRSVHHTMKNHNPAAYYALTGHAPPLDDIRLRDTQDLFPTYGSVVDRLAPVGGGVPTFVAYPHVMRDGSITPGQRASFLGREHDPFFVPRDPNSPDFSLPELTLPDTLSLGRIQKRRELQKLIDEQSKLLERSEEARGIDAYYKKALSLLNSEKVRKAFDLESEPAKLRERFGRHTYGQGCLLARRLVEHGVRFVSVYFSRSIGGQSTTSGGWDTHGFNNTRMYPIVEKYHLPMTDQTLPTLLHDLDDRGLLDETLVVWMGEFGRTPKINKNASRDHWPQCYTVLLAGGGVRRGYVHGSSDSTGAFPNRDPVRLDDLAATMFHLLGISPKTEVLDNAGRPLLIAEGDPVEAVIA